GRNAGRAHAGEWRSPALRLLRAELLHSHDPHPEPGHVDALPRGALLRAAAATRSGGVPVEPGTCATPSGAVGWSDRLRRGVERGPATAWIHARPLALVGIVSYGLYLWHLPLMLFGIRFGLLPHAFVPRLAVVLVPALFAGSASWLLVERVMLARASRIRRRR